MTRMKDLRGRLQAPRWGGALLFVGVFGTLLVVYALTRAPGLTWANYGLDGGDFAAAIATWGVPHPTGYPTYVLLGRLFHALLPLGEPLASLTLFSAVTMALAAGLLAMLVQRSLASNPWLGCLTGLVVGLAFGLAPVPWSQAVVAEIHGLNAAFVAASMVLMACMREAGRHNRWIASGMGLLAGVALGNHVTFVLIVPLMIVSISARDGPRDRYRALVWWGAGLVAGLMVYLYLPLASQAGPPINWGNPSTWRGFWWVVGGSPYQGMAFGLAIGEIPKRLAAWAGLLMDQFGFIGLALGVSGIVLGGSRYRPVDWTAAWLLVVYSIFAMGYDTADSYVYLIPAYIGFAWCLGLGLQALSTRLEKVRKPLAFVLPLAALLAIGVRTPKIWRQVDATRDRRAIEFASALMGQAPQDALVLTEGTEDTFALWYEHFALGQRPDLHVVVVPLAQFEWYREQLPGIYPDLDLPEKALQGTSQWAGELLAMNRLPVCRTHVTAEGVELEVWFECGD